MNYLIAVCAFFGGWLLVAGPVYQAALELEEQQVDQEQIQAAESSVTVPTRVSPWWWLLPPVAYILQQRQARAHRAAVLQALGPKELAQTVAFFNKANGWLIVASGAFLIAVKETWELVELLEWPVWVFWILIVVVALLCVGNAIVRMNRTKIMLQRDEDAEMDRAAAAAHDVGKVADAN